MKMSSAPVLVVSFAFPPAIAAGGPARSLEAIVRKTPSVKYVVLTSDRDLGANSPYSVSDHLTAPNVEVHYVHPRPWTIVASLLRISRSRRFQTLYLNSFLNFQFTAIPLLMARLGLIRVDSCVLAPRGELLAGAWGIRKRKKEFYLSAFRLLLLREVTTWHSTSPAETAAILGRFGALVRVSELSNLRVEVPTRRPSQEGDMSPGYVLFLGRVSPKKNLHGALQAMARMRTPARLVVAGSLGDEAYVARCRAIQASLPGTFQATWLGPVPREEVGALLAGARVLLHPAFDENFGHSIAESLSHGVPIIISPHTPWSVDTVDHCGWVVDPQDIDAIANALDVALSDDAVHERFSSGAMALASSHDLQTAAADYIGLLTDVRAE